MVILLWTFDSKSVYMYEVHTGLGMDTILYGDGRKSVLYYNGM